MYYKSLLLKCDFTYTSGDFKKKYETIRNYTKDYMLVKAIADGDLELAKYAVSKENADINTAEGYVLKIAATYGYLDIIKWLIEQGADIHIGNDAVFNTACHNGHLDIVRCLVKHGANIHIGDYFVLRSAADGGHFEIVKYLVEIGANVNAVDSLALTVACKRKHFEIVKCLMQAGAVISNQALTYAFSLEDSEIYDYLIKKY